MTKRAVRHDVIRDIIRKGNIKTQRDLVEQLSAEGYDCTQATVSRDIAGMGLAKSREGYYVLPEDLRLQRMVGELVDSIEVVNNFIVLRTPSGIASGVTVALDAAERRGLARWRRHRVRDVLFQHRCRKRRRSHPQAARSINQRFATRLFCERARISQNHSKQKWGPMWPPFSCMRNSR